MKISFRPLSGNRENQLEQRNLERAGQSALGFRPLSGNRENQLG